MSYLFGMYRDYELKKDGKPNKYGITIASCESKLRYIEIVVDLLIFVYVIIHLVAISKEELNDMPFLNFWMVTDCIIMFFTLPYTYMSKLMMVTGEITKNIFTLFQVQKMKLLKRRQEMKDQNTNSKAWKDYFKQKEEAPKKEEKISKLKKAPSMISKSNEFIKPKKKKKALNGEDAKKQDDLTSESSSDTESSSEDEMEKKFQNEKSMTIVVEMDHKINESLTFSKDVYNYTICANMTKCCSPLQ